MLAGEDGVGHIAFGDFRSAYLIGSVALAVILFEGGLKTTIPVLRLAFLPALLLATVGVLITAGIVGLVAAFGRGLPFRETLLPGAAVAPTDAAAVASLLRTARLAVPERVLALLEVESGLNDPMSIFLTVLLMSLLTTHMPVTAGHAAIVFVEEMLGGALFGVAGGVLLRGMLRRLRLDAALAPILSLVVRCQRMVNHPLAESPHQIVVGGPTCPNACGTQALGSDHRPSRSCCSAARRCCTRAGSSPSISPV